MLIIIIAFVLIVGGWGILTLRRYKGIKKRIRKKMEWSSHNDAFWDYDEVIKLAQQTYIKAQIFLNSKALGVLPHLSVYARARLLQLKRKVRNETDIWFADSYIVSFSDKKENQEDELKVFFYINNKNYKEGYKEIVCFKRRDNELILTDIIKNPTMYMISHSLSVVEKY